MTVHHAALETRREDAVACVAFWALLGFEQAEVPETLRDRALWVERDGRQIHFQYADDPVVPPRGHVAVIAPDDYEATLARLRGAGFEPRPREEHWGSPRAFVEDPAGHVVEVMAFPPA